MRRRPLSRRGNILPPFANPGQCLCEGDLSLIDIDARRVGYVVSLCLLSFIIIIYFFSQFFLALSNLHNCVCLPFLPLWPSPALLLRGLGLSSAGSSVGAGWGAHEVLAHQTMRELLRLGPGPPAGGADMGTVRALTLLCPQTSHTHT